MRIDLPFIPPYDGRSALRLLGAHAVAGSERFQDDTVTRLLPSSAGPVPVRVRFTADRIEAEIPDQAPLDELAPLIRFWLDLDLDPQAVVRGLAADTRIGPLVTAAPGLRRAGYPSPFEAVVLTVLGQQVSLAAGRTFAGRLVAAYGTDTAADLRAFPIPRALLAVPPDELQAAVGLTRARTRTVLAVAAAFHDDPRLAMAGPQSAERRESTAAALLSLPGIGPWTVAYLRMRLLADPDSVPASDLVLRKALGGMSSTDVAAAAEAWRPWGSYAVLHLWSTMSWS